jgi:hypothetical protein
MRQDRDQLTLDIMFLLMALVTPIMAVIVIEVAATWFFGLHSQTGHTVGIGGLILGALVSVFAVIWLNGDLKTDSHN